MANSVVLPIPTGAGATALVAVGAVDNMQGDTICIQNTGSITAFIGGSNVSTANGFPLVVGATLILDVAETLYAVVSGGVAGQVALLRVR